MGKDAVSNSDTTLFPVQRVTQPFSARGLIVYMPVRARAQTLHILDKQACPDCPVTLPKSLPGGIKREPRFLEAYTGRSCYLEGEGGLS